LAGDAQRLIYLRKINPYVFEELLLTAFERRGYRVRRNARYSGDGGLDGQVWIDGQRYLLQAKRYGRAISAQHLQSFGELVRQEHCMGFFIHTGRTMQTSRLVLQACPYVEVLSGNRLLKLLAGHADWHVGLADNAKRGDGRGVNHE
jgi:restriction system protein